VEEVEGRLHVHIGAARAEQKGDQGDAGQQKPEARRPEAVHQQDEERQEDIELFLDGERPGMEQRERISGRGEISGGSPEIDVRDRESRRQGGSGIILQLSRQHAEIGDGAHDRQQGDQSREDAPHAALVKGEQREVAGRHLPDDDRADQITGDHEEDIDPDEAAGECVELGVEGDHRQHRDRAQPVDIASVAPRHEAARLLKTLIRRPGQASGRVQASECQTSASIVQGA
jgi:hypothetical protein